MIVMKYKKHGNKKQNKDNNTFWDLPIAEQLSVVSKQYRKDVSLAKINDRYQEALRNYKMMYGLGQIDLFDNPFAYFMYYNSEVHFKYARSFPVLDNIYATFQLFKLPYSQTGEAELNLLRALRSLLQTAKAFPKYMVLLMLFEDKYKQQFPIWKFFLMEGNIAGFITKCNDIVCEVLCHDNMKDILGGEWVSKVSPILKAVRRKDILPNFCYEKADNPYYLVLNMGWEYRILWYSQTDRVFCGIRPDIQDVDGLSKVVSSGGFGEGMDINYLFHYVQIQNDNYKDIELSARIARFLFLLTKGNYQSLVNLAVLFANIASPELLTPKLFLITYPDADVEFDVDIVDYILYSSFGRIGSFPSIGKMLLNKNMPELLDSYFGGIMAFDLFEGVTKLSETQLERLKKYVKGARVSYKDASMGTMYYKNTKPIICFSNDHQEINFLEQNVPCFKIALDGLTEIRPEDTPVAEQYPRDYDWLRVCLPLYGLYLLAEKQFYKQPFPGNHDSNKTDKQDTIVNEFISVCCTARKSSYVYADELYEAYQEYYREISKNRPLKRTQFVKVLKRVKNIEYKRPHVSKTAPNKYAFVGIGLNADWRDDIKQTSRSLLLEEQAFKARLDKISDIVFAENGADR